MTRPLALALLAALAAAPQAQEVTGLSDWSLFLDPGHSQTENQGIYGYSEAEKTLRVGLALREMLLTRTDIDTVYISRTTDAEQVSLRQRTDFANSVGADFFHSLHSNAGPPSVNNVLMLYGGWRRNGETVEKTPEGGGRMGAEYLDAHTRAMRLPAAGAGNFADRTFYQGFPQNHDNQFPFLFVNRESAMASVLSESGFHTNPRQNTLNMNADWKRLEAQAFYWAILDWHGVPRSTHRIATGIVTDAESGRPVNGATVEIAGRAYTTDTFESLFNRYSSDPDQLANGFYYLEDVPSGVLTVTVSAPGYATGTAEVSVLDTDFSFADVQLVSTVPPRVVDANPADGDGTFPVTDALNLRFSRPLDPTTAAAAFSLVDAAGAAVAGTVSFEEGGYVLVFTPSAPLAARTVFTLTLAGSATTANGSPLDGNGDGVGGDDFTLSFTSSFPDTTAPRLAQSDPRPNAGDAELRPVVTAVFTEEVDPSTLEGRVTLEGAVSRAAVAGRYVHEVAGVVGVDPEPRSTVSFAPDAPLSPNTRYRFAIEPGVADRFSNESTSRYAFEFTTGAGAPEVRSIDAFEGSSIADNWWVPQQSGSTTGIETDSTAVAADGTRAYPLGGATSMRLDYGWSDGASDWLIRQYLAGGDPRSVTFDDSFTLRARVFGDGVGTLFRFAVDDGFSGGHEVSPWIAVDWYGWRTVSWDLDGGEFGTWIGNGAWDAPSQLRFDSFQLGYDGTSARFGAIAIDDLALTRLTSVAEEDGVAASPPLALRSARPNPFQQRTQVGFDLGAPANVTVTVYNAIGQRVAVLASGQELGAGSHERTWDASGAAAGVYMIRVQAGEAFATVPVVLSR